MERLRPWLHRWTWPFLAALLVLLALLLWLSPAERTLGQTVKLVYLHGALVQTAVIVFAASLPVNLAALVKDTAGWVAWGKALAWTATAAWLAHTLVSMVTTYAAWGLFIAWYEPRTRFTFILAGVAVLIVLVAYLVDHGRFTAAAFVILAGLALALLPRLGFIQHPLDPIGQSSSTSIRAFYAAMLAVSVLKSALAAAWLQARLMAGRRPGMTV
jgi:hypothetical protein